MGPCNEPRCSPQDHEFWISGATFRWQWPHLRVYVPGDKRMRAGLNRYPHNVIGAGVVIFGKCFSLTWKGSRR